jgi:hypothetical protein
MDPVHTHTRREKKKIYDASVAATSSSSPVVNFYLFQCGCCCCCCIGFLGPNKTLFLIALHIFTREKEIHPPYTGWME